MATYSYAQLMALWINAGGPEAEAPVAAAIAEAESGGNSDAHNPSGASGLWQILGNPFPGNPFDPATNARMAVAKYRHNPQGTDNFSPWVTYETGAYKAYLSNKTTPDGNVPGSPTAATAQGAVQGALDCLVPNPLGISVPLLGSISAGPSCLFSKSNARAFIGAGLVLAGGVMGLATLAFIAVAVGMRAAGPLGRAAEATGGALMLIPGAQPAGAAVSSAGRTARNPAAEGRRRGAARAREERAMERRLGEPRENPDLEVRGGAVREMGSQRAARQRRQRAASREDAGF
jgi:hypothetical protein